MRATGKLLWPFLFALAFLTLSRVFIFGATAAETINLPDAEGSYVVDDDDDADAPDVTARVARISFLKGDAQIRRADGGDWEKAVLNLPLVEGDEITTSADARLEIQFDNNQHLRLAENSYLKITNLKDEGIALSLSLGTMSVSITRFDKDKSYFEVDAPKTTIAVQKAGIYRINAGQAGDDNIRVSVTDEGEARVYSDNTGFTLKNGRTARIFIDGVNAGEWQADDVARFTDEFDTWSLDRDSAIALRLKDAFYDKYYDSDIYGADDLDGYGEWIHTARYGYVWRPSRNVTSSYADWSPYRYGHWRWIPVFGWTWVNDEPWGWATYHHGRWFFDDGFWYWSPYGYYRASRSWWRPALVVLNVYGGNVCWYPLSYNYAYYNFNYNYYHSHHHGGHWNGNHNGGGGGGHVPTGGIKVPHQTSLPPPKIPANSVVAMAMDDFGTTVKPVKTAPLSLANTVITAKVDETARPILPAYAAVTKKMSREIVVDRPKADLVAAQTKVGAAPRKADVPLDKELRMVRVLGGREPLVKTSDNGGAERSNNSTSDTRQTGAITRQPPVKQSDTTAPIRQTPKTRDDSPSQTVRTPRTEEPVKQEPTRSEPPVRQPPRSESAPVKQTPRSETPRTETHHSEPSRQPPVKSEPAHESKPSKAPESNTRKSKDG